MNAEEILSGHRGAVAAADLAHGDVGPVVHAVDLVAGEALEETILHHLKRAACAFLARLEDEHDRALEVLVLGEIFSSGKKHRHVAVMPAPMHLALILRLPLAASLLGHRERIHIASERDRAAGTEIPVNHADNARAPDMFRHLNSPAFELFGDHAGSPDLLETEFRMTVKLMTPLCIFRFARTKILKH